MEAVVVLAGLVVVAVVMLTARARQGELGFRPAGDALEDQRGDGEPASGQQLAQETAAKFAKRVSALLRPNDHVVAGLRMSLLSFWASLLWLLVTLIASLGAIWLKQSVPLIDDYFYLIIYLPGTVSWLLYSRLFIRTVVLTDTELCLIEPKGLPIDTKGIVRRLPLATASISHQIHPLRGLSLTIDGQTLFVRPSPTREALVVEVVNAAGGDAKHRGATTPAVAS